MRRQQLKLLALGCGATLLFSLGAGSALAGGYCGSGIDITDCFSTDEFCQDTCCADVNGQTRLVTCTREQFLCWDGAAWEGTAGPGYDYTEIGNPCTP